jgi:hypothetical protein
VAEVEVDEMLGFCGRENRVLVAAECTCGWVVGERSGGEREW